MSDASRAASLYNQRLLRRRRNATRDASGVKQVRQTRDSDDVTSAPAPGGATRLTLVVVVADDASVVDVTLLLDVASDEIEGRVLRAAQLTATTTGHVSSHCNNNRSHVKSLQHVTCQVTATTRSRVKSLQQQGHVSSHCNNKVTCQVIATTRTHVKSLQQQQVTCQVTATRHVSSHCNNNRSRVSSLQQQQVTCQVTATRHMSSHCNNKVTSQVIATTTGHVSSNCNNNRSRVSSLQQHVTCQVIATTTGHVSSNCNNNRSRVSSLQQHVTCPVSLALPPGGTPTWVQCGLDPCARRAAFTHQHARSPHKTRTLTPQNGFC